MKYFQKSFGLLYARYIGVPIYISLMFNCNSVIFMLHNKPRNVVIKTLKPDSLAKRNCATTNV